MTVASSRLRPNNTEDDDDQLSSDGFEQAELGEGTWLDVLDSGGHWQEAEVVSLRNNACLVHFLFWPEERDEWVSLDSTRLAPHGSRTFSEYGSRNSLMVGQDVQFFDIHPARNEWVVGRVVGADDARVNVRFSTSDGESMVECVQRGTKRLRPLPYRGHHRQSRDPRRVGARGRGFIGQVQHSLNRGLSGRGIAIPSRRVQQLSGGSSSSSSSSGSVGIEDERGGRYGREEQKYSEARGFRNNRAAAARGVGAGGRGGGVRLQFSERGEGDDEGLMMEERERDIAPEDDPRMVRYQRTLEANGFQLVNVQGDGNCLFRTVSHQIYGTERHHMLVRVACVDYMKSEAAYFQPFVVGDAQAFQRYLAIKRKDGVWGDDIEIQAMCEIYNRPAQIYAFDHVRGFRQLRTFHEGGLASGVVPMRLSFYGGGHYDSLVWPDDYRQGLLQEPGRMEHLALQQALARRRRRRNSNDSNGSSATTLSYASSASLSSSPDRRMNANAHAAVGGADERAVASSAPRGGASGSGASFSSALPSIGGLVSSAGATAASAVLRSTDNDATEQTLLDDALQQSRKQYDEGTDVERALKESLVGSVQAEEIQVAQALEESLLLADQHSSSSSSILVPHGDDGGAADVEEAIKLSLMQGGGGGNDIDDVERALRQSREAADQHEAELVRKALAESAALGVRAGGEGNVNAEDDDDDAERLEIQRVLEMSRLEAVKARGGGGGGTGCGALGLEQQGGGLEVEGDNDEALQLALAMSMSRADGGQALPDRGEEQQHALAAATTAATAAAVTAEDDTEEALLRRAIAESLKE
jgi:hypothetical protein